LAALQRTEVLGACDAAYLICTDDQWTFMHGNLLRSALKSITGITFSRQSMSQIHPSGAIKLELELAKLADSDL